MPIRRFSPFAAINPLRLDDFKLCKKLGKDEKNFA
jgi:hypothetical protein